MTPSRVQRAASEIAGTALLVGIGTGAIVAADRWGNVPTWGLPVAWFLAVLVPIALFVDLSGAHLNPAVTLALAMSRRAGWSDVPLYAASQLAGAFAASLTIRALLGGGSRLGATVPGAEPLPLGFAGEAVFTALLVGTVFLLADRGFGRGRWRLLLPPAVVGLSTYVIGPWTGSSLNPARTLAPAVVSGTYTDLGLYLVVVPAAAVVVAFLARRSPAVPTSRGPDD